MNVTNNTAYRADGYIIYASHDQLYESLIKEFDIDVFIEKNTGLYYAAFVVAVVALLTVIWGAFVSSVLSVYQDTPSSLQSLLRSFSQQIASSLHGHNIGLCHLTP